MILCARLTWAAHKNMNNRQTWHPRGCQVCLLFMFLCAAQVSLAHKIICKQILSSIAQDNLPSLQHIATIGQTESHGCILFHEKDGDALVANAQNGVKY